MYINIRIIRIIHTCIYTYTYTYIYTNIHTNTYTCTYTYIHKHMIKHKHIHINIHVHTHAHIWVDFRKGILNLKLGKKGPILSQKRLISNRRNLCSLAPKVMHFPSKDRKLEDLCF